MIWILKSKEFKDPFIQQVSLKKTQNFTLELMMENYWFIHILTWQIFD
jgi:hypothetical protein